MGYVSIGTFSIETSVSKRDFLCLRLQRLRTSSDTVSRAAEPNKGRGSFPQQECSEQYKQYSIHLHFLHTSAFIYIKTTELQLHLRKLFHSNYYSPIIHSCSVSPDWKAGLVHYLPGKPRSGCSPQTCHSSCVC